jgi:hypothetical protein
MRRDAVIAAAGGSIALAGACRTAIVASDDASSSNASIAALVIVAMALHLYAALRATEAFKPMRVERDDGAKPYDPNVSDFDVYNHRGRAVRAFLS